MESNHSDQWTSEGRRVYVRDLSDTSGTLIHILTSNFGYPLGNSAWPSLMHHVLTAFHP